MNRLWTKNSTGVATNGRWYAGDINQLQDVVAALSDFLQTLDVNVLRIGDASLQLLKYGTSEFRMSGALRTDGIMRALGGFYAGAFTTPERDAIPTGFHPYGLVILNTTTNRLEVNLGSDATPTWLPVGVDPAGSLTFAGQPANNYFISASRTGDTNPRFRIREDGQHEWGPGSGVTDTTLARSAAGVLQLGGVNLAKAGDAPTAHQTSHKPGGSDAIAMERAKATRSAAFSVPNSTLTVVPFDTEEYDVPGGMHDLVTANSRITIPVAGVYMVGGGGVFASSANANYARLLLNGATVLPGNTLTTAPGGGTICFPQTFAVNDYIELQVNQNSGSANNLSNAFLFAHRVF